MTKLRRACRSGLSSVVLTIAACLATAAADQTAPAGDPAAQAPADEGAENRLYIDSKREDTLFQTRIGRTVNVGVNVQF